MSYDKFHAILIQVCHICTADMQSMLQIFNTSMKQKLYAQSTKHNYFKNVNF